MNDKGGKVEERARDKKNEQSMQTDKRKEKGKQTHREQQKLFHVNVFHWRR